MSGDLIDTTEMYLKTIYELAEEGIVPLRARIAERLGHSGPTVSQTVGRMERDGLVVVNDDRHLELTAEGWRIATRVMRKHRLAERLLTDVIGLEWPFVHDEACRWEHVMSDRVEQRILELLDRPRHSPYGNPIPGLDALGVDAAAEEPTDEYNLTAPEVTGPVVVRRLCESVQTNPDLLRQLHAAGINPGATVTVTQEKDVVRVKGANDEVQLPREVAARVFVAAA